MSIVLHLLPSTAWDSLGTDEPVTNASLEHEGFIHCTDEAAVLLQIANRFYTASSGDFVVLHVDTDLLTSRCIWEEPAHVDGSTGPSLAPTFPHVYGPIDRVAIVATRRIDRDASGRFTGYGPVEPAA